MNKKLKETEKIKPFSFDDDPIYLSRFANGYVSTQCESYFKASDLNQKLNYKNLIFESEYNDYISIIKTEYNFIKRYKKTCSIEDFFGNNNFLDPWKSSRSRNAKSVPRAKTRYLVPINTCNSS